MTEGTPPALIPAQAAKKSAFSLKTGSMMIITGIILLGFGGVLSHAFDHVQEYPQNYWSKYDGTNGQNLDDDRETYDTFGTIDRIFEKIGVYFGIIGLMLILVSLLGTALLADAVDSNVRLGMLVMAGFIIWASGTWL